MQDYKKLYFKCINLTKMGNLLKSKKSGMVGYQVNEENLAEELIKYFEQKGSSLAWRNSDKYGLEVLIPEQELLRLEIKATEVTKEMRGMGFFIPWPAHYGDPHFTYL